MRRFTAGENETGMRISRFVEKVTYSLPEAVLYKSFRNKRVKINGKKAAPADRLAPGDVVELYINDEFFAPEPAAVAGRPERPPLPFPDILWENNQLAVLYKPAGLLCHSDATGDTTLQQMFVEYLTQKGEYLPDKEHSFTPSLCNRIDRGTEGLVLAAKTYPALREANALLRNRLLTKTYLCITTASPPEGLHTAYLQRDMAEKTTHISLVPAPGAQEIKTEIHLCEQKGSLCLCEIGLHTGRTHQIRAHLAFMGAPLWGDRKYGKPAANLRGQALCAWTLRFPPVLPEDSILFPLAGQCFKATHPTLLQAWQKLNSNIE